MKTPSKISLLLPLLIGRSNFFPRAAMHCIFSDPVSASNMTVLLAHVNFSLDTINLSFAGRVVSLNNT